MKKIDPSPAQVIDELEFIELPGINDDSLDQELAEATRHMRNWKALEMNAALMLVAQQLPAQLEFQLNLTSELKDAAYERLRGLLNDAIHSGKYSKLRRLSTSLASFRHLQSINSLQRNIAKESSQTGSTQRACRAGNSDMYAYFVPA